MKTFMIILGVIAVVAILWNAIRYHRDIRHGRCPICGAPIEPLVNGHVTGYQCTECDWWEATDEYGNVY